MSNWFFTLLILLIAVAGWFYLFYSKAAQRLQGFEHSAANQRRIVLRRINGAAMILLAVVLYVGVQSVSVERAPWTFVVLWLGVFVLLLVIVVLGLLDVRLTMRLRAGRRFKLPRQEDRFDPTQMP